MTTPGAARPLLTHLLGPPRFRAGRAAPEVRSQRRARRGGRGELRRGLLWQLPGVTSGGGARACPWVIYISSAYRPGPPPLRLICISLECPPSVRRRWPGLGGGGHRETGTEGRAGGHTGSRGDTRNTGDGGDQGTRGTGGTRRITGGTRGVPADTGGRGGAGDTAGEGGHGARSASPAAVLTSEVWGGDVTAAGDESRCRDAAPGHAGPPPAAARCPPRGQRRRRRQRGQRQRSFQGSHGRAYLFNSVVNVGCGPAEQRLLLTGLHSVADIFCQSCKTTLGWKYEQAFESSQKYKEGKFIIEMSHMVKENGWD
uniref:Yippee like 4 n=1 Tax=Calidris pygmaea TaxID=425635 RepID=A0A8C3JCY7_9CHAR